MQLTFPNGGGSYKFVHSTLVDEYQQLGFVSHTMRIVLMSTDLQKAMRQHRGHSEELKKLFAKLVNLEPESYPRLQQEILKLQ